MFDGRTLIGAFRAHKNEHPDVQDCGRSYFEPFLEMVSKFDVKEDRRPIIWGEITRHVSPEVFEPYAGSLSFFKLRKGLLVSLFKKHHKETSVELSAALRGFSNDRIKLLQELNELEAKIQYEEEHGMDKPRPEDLFYTYYAENFSTLNMKRDVFSFDAV